MAGLKTGGKGKPKKGTKEKPKTDPKQRLIPRKSIEAEFLALSIIDQEALLRPQIAQHPVFQLIGHDELRRGMREDEEEIPAEEFFDAPDIEGNIETGEGGREPDFFSEYAEGFLQFAHHKLWEDFDPSEDADVIHEIRQILSDWQLSPSSLDQIPEHLKIWFAELLEEFPLPQSLEHSPYTPRQADIIFHMVESELGFEVNPGFWQQYALIDKPSRRKIPLLTIGAWEVSPYKIFELLQERKEALKLVAQLLIQKQSAFLLAPPSNSDREKLNRLTQIELVEFCRERGLERDKYWANRIVGRKWVELPGNGEIVSLGTFFTKEDLDELRVLERVMELHQDKPPLRREDQNLIIRALLGKKVESQSMKTARRKLGIKGKPGRTSGGANISDEDLAELMNRVAQDLEIEAGPFTVNDITSIRKAIKAQDTGKNTKEEENFKRLG